MGTRAVLPVEEYLHTSFPDLDKEYRDGELVERSLPDNLHSETQGLIVGFFVALRHLHRFFVRPELRLKLREGLYLIPDISIFHPQAPTEDVPSSPPYVAVEILSPDDREARVLEKLKAYRAWSVAHIWLVDPHSRRMYIYDGAQKEVVTLAIPELGIELKPSDIFD